VKDLVGLQLVYLQDASASPAAGTAGIGGRDEVVFNLMIACQVGEGVARAALEVSPHGSRPAQ
jgi:hypothetical protein